MRLSHLVSAMLVWAWFSSGRCTLFGGFSGLSSSRLPRIAMVHSVRSQDQWLEMCCSWFCSAAILVIMRLWLRMVSVDGLEMALFSIDWLLIQRIIQVPVLITVVPAMEVSCIWGLRLYHGAETPCQLLSMAG